jgi:hypothetical protein
VVVFWCSSVGLDAGRGTTRVTSVASALSLKIRASGATASITEHCNRLSQVSLSHAASLAEATREV